MSEYQSVIPMHSIGDTEWRNLCLDLEGRNIHLMEELKNYESRIRTLELEVERRDLTLAASDEVIQNAINITQLYKTKYDNLCIAIGEMLVRVFAKEVDDNE